MDGLDLHEQQMSMTSRGDLRRRVERQPNEGPRTGGRAFEGRHPTFSSGLQAKPRVSDEPGRRAAFFCGAVPRDHRDPGGDVLLEPNSS